MKRQHVFLILFICALAAGSNVLWDRYAPVPDTTITIGNQQFTLETANTHAKRMRGLMYRRDLAECGGMVFFFPKAQILRFWMHNTPTPLWIAFVSEDRKIINIISKAMPMNDAPLYAGDEADMVIEVNAACPLLPEIAAGDTVNVQTAEDITIR